MSQRPIFRIFACLLLAAGLFFAPYAAADDNDRAREAERREDLRRQARRDEYERERLRQVDERARAERERLVREDRQRAQLAADMEAERLRRERMGEPALGQSGYANNRAATLLEERRTQDRERQRRRDGDASSQRALSARQAERSARPARCSNQCEQEVTLCKVSCGTTVDCLVACVDTAALCQRGCGP